MDTEHSPLEELFRELIANEKLDVVMAKKLLDKILVMLEQCVDSDNKK